MTTALPMLSAAGAVKGFGQSVNNLLRHSVFAANDSAAMQKVRDIQMSKALWENGSMEEMILTDHSRDILGNFRTDTKAETNDKLQHLKDLGLDASGIEKEVLRWRAVLEAARRQRETEADARAAQEVDQTRGREDISTNPYAGQRANMSAVKKVIGGLVDGVKGWFGIDDGLIKYENDHLICNEDIIIDKGFKDSFDRIVKYAEDSNVKLVINDSFRKVGEELHGTVADPVDRSNHFVGHAIDMNPIFDNKIYDSKQMKNDFSNLPDPVKNFINSVRNDQFLRWGGDFRRADTVHIDDGLNHVDTKKWIKKYRLYQEGE